MGCDWSKSAGSLDLPDAPYSLLSVSIRGRAKKKTRVRAETTVNSQDSSKKRSVSTAHPPLPFRRGIQRNVLRHRNLLSDIYSSHVGRP